jgi:pimeloyl-ACP methyl ester carboxylesterase
MLLTGCMSPSVERVPPGYWSRVLTENALTTGHVGEQTAAYLALRGWEGKALRRPEPILRELRAELIRTPDRAGLVAFAECAYWAGSRTDDRAETERLLLTAARAAYAAVFDEQMGPTLDPLDPNLRFAADLYNYALSRLLETLLEAGRTPRGESAFELMEGRLTVSKGHGMDQAAAFTKTLIAFSHRTAALELHNRRRGLGVPIVAMRPPEILVDGKELVHPPVYQAGMTPVTLLLRFGEPWRATGDALTATAELWNPLASTQVEVAGQRLPLEADTSLALAMLYERGAQYRGLLNMPRLLRGGSVEANRGLFLLAPYDGAKIPVVLTHGLMDSPLTWVPMLNALLTDPELSERYQFWLFFYPTMNPILQSASELRQSLLALHGHLQADGREWNDMVLVGHSMGGLITRLLITPSGESFRNLEQAALSAGEGDADFQAYLRSLVTFEPLPFVREAVFLGAPHRGATMANRPAGAAGQGLMRQPDYIRGFLEAKEGRAERLSRQANGIANLAPDSLFSLALGNSTWSPAVPVHSIIGDLWHAGGTNGSDSVVAYWSSHVAGAASELVVRANHLELHKQVPAIAEVRRILLEHPKAER